jgi:hypothetical protein
MPEQLEEWYIVFDDHDLHPMTGESMGGRYIILNGDQDTARREACRRFGNQWAAQLPRAETDAAGGFAYEPLEPDGLWGGAFGEQSVENERTFGPHYAGRRSTP